MELISAGFHDVVEHTAADLAILRSEVAGENRHFLNGVDAWLGKARPVPDPNAGVGLCIVLSAVRIRLMKNGTVSRAE